MFPSRSQRFAQRLEAASLLMVQHPLIAEGCNVFSWQGIRSEESLKRSCYPMWEQSPDSEGLTIYRPLMGWTLKDVVAIHQRHGLNLNPLYGMGLSALGAYPASIPQKRHPYYRSFSRGRLKRSVTGKRKFGRCHACAALHFFMPQLLREFWPGADRRSRTLVKNPSRRKAVRYTVPDGTVHLRCLYLRGRAM